MQGFQGNGERDGDAVRVGDNALGNAFQIVRIDFWDDQRHVRPGGLPVQQVQEAVRVAGLGNRLPQFVRPLEEEFKCQVRSLLGGAVSDGSLGADARPLAEKELEGLVGWMRVRN